MFRVSKLTDYGTVLMTYLAQHPEVLHNARDINLHTHVALPTASKLLKLLTKGGLLVSHRGALGGYSLARPPEQITIAQVIQALEGDFAVTECSHSQGLCAVEPWCHIRGNWQLINVSIREALKDITLADMIRPLSREKIQFKVLQWQPQS